jgi:hypothetical protein
MWITKLLDIITLGVTFYFRKEALKRKNQQELEILKIKASGVRKNEKP